MTIVTIFTNKTSLTSQPMEEPRRQCALHFPAAPLIGFYVSTLHNKLERTRLSYCGQDELSQFPKRQVFRRLVLREFQRQLSRNGIGRTKTNTWTTFDCLHRWQQHPDYNVQVGWNYLSNQHIKYTRHYINKSVY